MSSDFENFITDAIAVVSFSLVNALSHVNDLGISECNMWDCGWFDIGEHIVYLLIVLDDMEICLFTYEDLTLMVNLVDNGAVTPIEFVIFGDAFEGLEGWLGLGAKTVDGNLLKFGVKLD